MTNQIQIDNLKNEEDIQEIVDSINNYNYSKTTNRLDDISFKINLVAKNSKNELIGGLLSHIGYFKGLEVHILWVKDNYRKQNIGSQLLKKAESIAIQKGARKAILDTYSFQAKEFYLKNGYEICGEIEDFPEGHSLFFMVKDL
jgi:ribosomal protein S18 acetylase RimI-like enzyme